ncbi:MAG: DUF4256 domain-containing protein [Erysipelothrix sp.]|nr:DUF4256 domain-containing protein [Erysipelothrix sp.]
MKHQELMELLEARFSDNMHRHKTVQWDQVSRRLNEDKLKVLSLMEESGGEPDVMSIAGELVFVDFAKESPKGRRSLCYDQRALSDRKKNKPQDSAMNLAQEMGISLLNETEYRALQAIEAVDLKTSSWIVTPEAIRKLGGALFGDQRYGQVFIYHNGADSYYGARGFRGLLNL